MPIRNAPWDYVVIGAGHNGLSAAIRLAESGASVLVVEQLAILGGLATSHPYVANAPQHILSLGAMDDMFIGPTGLARLYDLEQFGYQFIDLEAPYGWMNEDGDTLLLFKDFERTIAEIQFFSRKDAQTYREIRRGIDWMLDVQGRLSVRHPGPLGKLEIGGMLLRLARDKPIRTMIGRMLSISAFEMVAETFESDAMRGLWAFWTGMSALADAAGSGIALGSFGPVHRGGVQRPIGGMGGLIRALCSKLQHHGGEIRAGVAVDRIVVRDGRAVGVRLVDGNVLEAQRGVLATCAPQNTLGKLLEPSELTAEARTAHRFMPANSGNVAAFKIDAAMGSTLRYPRAQAARTRRDAVDIRKTTFMTGTLDDHLAHWHAMKLGLHIPCPPVYMSILSATDESLAPKGEDVLYLHANSPVEPQGGWATSKAQYSASMRASARRFIDGLDFEIGSIETSPQDFERRFSIPRGCYFHVDMIPTRMGRNRPANGFGEYVLPISRLYLSGAGTHPGGGVNGWPGRLAAERALRD